VRQLLLLTDNPYVKALLLVIAVATLVYVGGMDPTSAGFFTVDQITTAVTHYTEIEMGKLEAEAAMFGAAAADRRKMYEDAEDKLNSGLSTKDAARLSRLTPDSAYITGPELTMYAAIGMQSDAYEIAIHTPYDKIKSYYDEAFILGVV